MISKVLRKILFGFLFVACFWLVILRHKHDSSSLPSANFEPITTIKQISEKIVDVDNNIDKNFKIIYNSIAFPTTTSANIIAKIAQPSAPSSSVIQHILTNLPTIINKQPITIHQDNATTIRLDRTHELLLRLNRSISDGQSHLFEPFNYSIMPAVCVNNVGSSIKSIIYIPIGNRLPIHSQMRTIIRDAWANGIELLAHKVVFVITNEHDNSTNLNEDINIEKYKFNDILMIDNLKDNAKNLVHKWWSILSYHVHHCSHVDYMLVIDSDTLIFVDNFVKFFNETHQLYTNRIGCTLLNGQPTMRQPSDYRYVSTSVWPFAILPPYCISTMQIIHINIAKKLINAIIKFGAEKYLSFGANVDIASGAIAYEADVELMNLAGIRNWLPIANICTLFAVHGLKSNVSMQALIDYRNSCCRLRVDQLLNGRCSLINASIPEIEMVPITVSPPNDPDADELAKLEHLIPKFPDLLKQLPIGVLRRVNIDLIQKFNPSMAALIRLQSSPNGLITIKQQLPPQTIQPQQPQPNQSQQAAMIVTLEKLIEKNPQLLQQLPPQLLASINSTLIEKYKHDQSSIVQTQKPQILKEMSTTKLTFV